MIFKLRDFGLIGDLQSTVRTYFPADTRTYQEMELETYRGIVALAQGYMNTRRMARLIAEDLLPNIGDMLGIDDLLVQSNLYLRATRPLVRGQENVGWHRETFYGCPPETINVWVPVQNCTADNCMHYIPGSESIPDSEIVTVSEEDPTTPRHSKGHKIGLLYAPKRIVSGVDLSTAVPMEVPIGSAAIFSGQVIHGAATNRTKEIRFSVDFRVIAKRHAIENKKNHFASGQDYFVPLEVA